MVTLEEDDPLAVALVQAIRGGALAVVERH
jgi:hypothetical protein